MLRLGERQADAGGHAAAAAGRRDDIGNDAQRCAILGDLQPDCPLPGDDARVVVGVDQNAAGASPAVVRMREDQVAFATRSAVRDALTPEQRKKWDEPPYTQFKP